MNEDKDLTVARVIKAPRATVWKAWKNPEHFVKWWTHTPVKTISNKHELFAGGDFDTTMTLEDGTVMYSVSLAWYAKLFARAPDEQPMEGLAEWHYGDSSGLQLFENAKDAGHGTLILIVEGL